MFKSVPPPNWSSGRRRVSCQYRQSRLSSSCSPQNQYPWGNLNWRSKSRGHSLRMNNAVCRFRWNWYAWSCCLRNHSRSSCYRKIRCSGRWYCWICTFRIDKNRKNCWVRWLVRNPHLEKCTKPCWRQKWSSCPRLGCQTHYQSKNSQQYRCCRLAD